MTQELTEEQARKEAQELARRIGDSEWMKGETKYALEAYEASDITITELFEKAQNLLRAENLIQEWEDAARAVTHFSREEHERSACLHGQCDEFISSCKCNCLACRTNKELVQEYYGKIRALLGWRSDVRIHWRHGARPQCRAAAVACLKLIKRLSK